MELHKRFIYDDGLLIGRQSGKIYCNFDRDGYIRVRIDGREYRAHRLIWEMFNGPIPEGLLVDHIDRDVYNNRIENLRLATRSQNNANSRAKSINFTGYKGITKVGSRYRARITHDGITLSLGVFDTAEEAKSAYDQKALEIHGNFAKLD